MNRPTQINPLIIETNEEQKLNEQAMRDSKKRKELRTKSLRKHTPDVEETKVIHKMWQEQVLWHGRICLTVLWMG